jgi:hypothetical protein
MEYGPKIKIISPSRPKAGSFANFKKIINNEYVVYAWHYCREVWHSQFFRPGIFFFSHKADCSKNVASFIYKIENDLDINPKTKFGPTQNRTMMWMEASPWWLKLAMRKSLFTILLRVADAYDLETDNFQEALYSSHYTQNTRYAIDRFMKGNTHYTGKKSGWYRQFYLYKPTKDDIDKLLIKISSK